jgi:hypothetical protein
VTAEITGYFRSPAMMARDAELHLERADALLLVRSMQGE